MKKFLLLALILSCAATAWAIRPDLPVDGKGIRIPNFAPDAKKQQTLTVNRTAVNMTDDLQFAVFNPLSSCKFRVMSTATKAGTMRYLPKNANYQRAVNPSAPFLNVTACTNGTLERQ